MLDGDEVAAYLLTCFWDADAAATGVREAFVGQLGVRPTWRRRGLGRLLLATALVSYRAAGYARSGLTVDTGNATGALRLYERAEFAVKDTSVVWTKPWADLPLWSELGSPRPEERPDLDSNQGPTP